MQHALLGSWTDCWAPPTIYFLTKKRKVFIFIEMFLTFMGASLAAS